MSRCGRHKSGYFGEWCPSGGCIPLVFFFRVGDSLRSHQPRDTDHGPRSCGPPPARAPGPKLSLSTVLFSYPPSYHSTEIFGSRPPMLPPFIPPQHSCQFGHEPRHTDHGPRSCGQTKLGISCVAHNPRYCCTFAKHAAWRSVLSRITGHVLVMSSQDSTRSRENLGKIFPLTSLLATLTEKRRDYPFDKPKLGATLRRP